MRVGFALVGILLGIAALATEALGAGGQSGFGPQQVTAVVLGLAGVAYLAYRRFGGRALVVTLVLFLTAATVYVQYRGLANYPLGENASIDYAMVLQLGTHEATLDGEGGNPWQYRILSEWGAAVTLDLARALDLDPELEWGFVSFRVLQNLAIFALAWAFLGRFGFEWRMRVLGVGLLAWAMTQALHNSNLSFNTYTDLIAYLAAAILILDRRYLWIVPLTAVAALNRETAGLIPLMQIAVALALHDKRALRTGLAALAAYVVVTVSLRAIIGSGELIKPHGRSPGWDLFYWNLQQGETWEFLFRTLNIVPLLALTAIRRWPAQLKAFALAIVPIWVVVHAFGSVLAETRLMLVPYMVVLVPAALLALSEDREAAALR